MREVWKDERQVHHLWQTSSMSPSCRSGFSLVQISILLTVAALIFTVALPTARQKNTNDAVTAARLNTVVSALRSFEASNGRLPCPADATQPVSSANFGVEATNSSNCSGGTIKANYVDSTNNIAIGMIPLRAIGLSNDYGMDGYGRIITYAVDTTVTGSCPWLGTSGTLPGHIVVTDNGTAYNSVFALVSHGADGHGAFIPLTGSTGTAARLNASSSDTDQLTNAHVDTSFNPTTTLTNFVRKPSTATFDDVVIYQNPSWVAANQPAASPVCVYERPLTINHARVSGAQAYFPVLVSITDATLKSAANGGHVNNASGYDVTFTADLARTQLLNSEIESYNASSGQLVAWVSMPVLSATADTAFYMSYGNYNITASQNATSAVWDSNFLGVWHFANGTALSVLDSTANANSGTISGATATGAAIGGGVYINDTAPAYVSVPNQAFAGDFTFEGWADIIAEGSDALANQAVILGPNPYSINGSNRQWRLYNGSDVAVSSSAVTLGTWHHIVVTRAGTAITLYQDGASNATGTSNSTYSFTEIGSNTSNDSAGRYAFDEVRTSAVARSAGWIATEYNNQSAPSSFITMGSESIVSR